MVAPINPTQLTPPRVDFIDPRSGAISREWYRFFLSLLTATQTNQEETELPPDATSLLASYDAVFGGAVHGLESAPSAVSASDLAAVETELQGLESAPSAASASDLAAVETELQALALSVPARGGVLPATEGGTGATNLTSGYLLKGNGASAVTSSVVYDTGTNVGIGITNPQQLLAIGTSIDQIGAGVSGAVSTVYFGSPSDVPAGGIKRLAYDRNLGSLDFIGGSVASPSTQMTLDSDGNLGIGISVPSGAAILELQSTTRGFRLPTMTTTQKNAIPGPGAGLMVFDTTLAKACVYSGTAWETITSV
jgi:hypothetical protein